MVGHSLGGTAVLAAGSQIESLKAVATVGSPSSPDHILHMLENQLDEIASKGEPLSNSPDAISSLSNALWMT